MRVLAIDVGGTNVKRLSTGQTIPRRALSGPTMTPKEMVAAVKALTAEWEYDAVAIGYPGQVIGGRTANPASLRYVLSGEVGGWIADIAAA